ncbi:hypothetical protein UlMin_021876 [Ulmus minor]
MASSLILILFMASYFAYFTASTTSRSLFRSIEEEDLVSDTCKKTLYFQVCSSSLKSDPRSQTSDLQGLASISLNLSVTNGAEILSYISSLKSDKSVSGHLSDCADLYSDAVQNLEESVQSINDKSYDMVKSLVSAAMTDADTCEDGFKEIEGVDSPLTERNQYFNKLCSNSLAITTLLV